MSLTVREPGLLTSVQDLGRPAFGALGVPVGGAMDLRALSIANLLLGNDRGAAALEMTLIGPTLELSDPLTIALAGADLGGRTDTGRRLLPGRSYRLGPGTSAFPGARDGATAHGSRAYLALPGGVDVPIVLGSRSTCLAGAFGGFDGRLLAAGDRLDALEPERRAPSLVWPLDEVRPTKAGRRRIRVLPGPDPGHAGMRQALDQLTGRSWTVSAQSDRMGVRLDGTPIETESGGNVLSHGVPWGAIQLPPSGLPIVLAADHQTTGGYPVIGVVATVDRDAVGQLGPGDEIEFEVIDLATARQALIEADARFDALAAQLEEARRLVEALDWAGA